MRRLADRLFGEGKQEHPSDDEHHRNAFAQAPARTMIDFASAGIGSADFRDSDLSVSVV